MHVDKRDFLSFAHTFPSFYALRLKEKLLSSLLFENFSPSFPQPAALRKASGREVSFILYVMYWRRFVFYYLQHTTEGENEISAVATRQLTYFDVTSFANWLNKKHLTNSFVTLAKGNLMEQETNREWRLTACQHFNLKTNLFHIVWRWKWKFLWALRSFVFPREVCLLQFCSLHVIK